MPSAFADDVRKDFVVEDIKFTIKKLSLGDQMEVSRRFKEEGDTGATMGMLVGSLVAWNVMAKDGIKELDINVDNIKRLRFDIINKVVKEISDFNNLSDLEIKNL